MRMIAGERVTLRTFTREEFHAFMRAYVPDPAMDPEPYAYDAARTDALFARNAAREAHYATLGVFLPGGEVIGSVSLKRIDLEKSRCEIGITLTGERVKGKGYGTEAFALAVRYAFETLGLRYALADTMGGNARMRRILDKLGFRCYMRMEQCYDMHGRWEDRLDYVLENPAWRAEDACP